MTYLKKHAKQTVIRGNCRGLSDHFICAERATEVMRLNVTGRRNNDLEILTYGKRQG